MTVWPNPGTDASMAKVGWTVQSAFYDRNSHATRESSLSLCREAAQSNCLFLFVFSAIFAVELLSLGSWQPG